MTLPEALTQETVADLCRDGFLLALSPNETLSLDASAVRSIDGAGLAFLLWLQRRLEGKGGHVELLHLSPAIMAQLEAYRETAVRYPVSATRPRVTSSRLVRIGEKSFEALAYVSRSIIFLGMLLLHLLTVAKGHICWREGREAFVRAGVQAVPVVLLMGFLLGLILAFQSAIPLEMFGAESFVGGLVGIALVRELGLILTAILVAGRTGSAFAAEMGTMKVNEELDALETMGLSPIRFLVIPRVLAGMVALPLLSLFATFAGLVGGWVVMILLGFSLPVYINQLTSFVAFGDLLGSLVKAFVFGFTLSAVGCYCGLQAQQDAQGVGRATTTAVVSGIMLVAFLEGLFSVLFYAMGW